ncbi:MAG TPA: FtsX-like permease family protein [Phycisphaerae bacterium]|nr:FtsX-like permease family protein [Phycisphaerae bacterium]
MTRWILSLTALALALAGCSPRGSTGTDEKEESDRSRSERIAAAKEYYGDIPRAADEMLPAIRQHARALADLGPRQTGQQGCDQALAYIRGALADVAAKCPITDVEPKAEVTVALDRLSADDLERTERDGREFTQVVVAGGPFGQQTWPAYALAPNCVQACATHPPEACPVRRDAAAGAEAGPCPNCESPRRLVDIGDGSWEGLRDKDVNGAVVLLDFNSADAWVRAASLGAAGAVFIAPQTTTVFQADGKYMAMLPLHVPRVYLRRDRGLALQDALAGGAGDVQVTLKSRLQFANVPARGVELTIPGTDSSYCMVLAAHFDARCIAPDLSYGADEVWGIAELIELTRYLAARERAPDIKVMFVSGHWQGQRLVRDYVAYKSGRFDRIGVYYKMAMSLDMVPAGHALNLMTETAWNTQSRGMYRWLGNRLFNDGGWRDKMRDGLGLPDDVELYGGERSNMSETGDGNLANKRDRSAFVYAPRYPTAEEPWQAVGLPTVSFQTARLARLNHFTPLDRLGPIDDEAVDDQLRPQLRMTLGVLKHLFEYPRKKLPRDGEPYKHRGRGWGGYAEFVGRVQQIDPRTGWYKNVLPGSDQGMKTFLYAWPADGRTTALLGPGLHNYMHWPMNPDHGQHRGLQSFMFQDMMLLDEYYFQINAIYAAYPEVEYDVVAYTIDEAGRVRYAADYGARGGERFPSTDLQIDTMTNDVSVSVFECGTLELFGLIDPQRYNPGTFVRGAHYHTYAPLHSDPGVAPYLRVSEVKNVDSHTDMERWGFTQYGPTAMVFLPATAISNAEVLLGGFFTNVAVLSDPDPDGLPRGYRVGAGETIRLSSADTPTSLQCIRELASLNAKRLREFSRYDVRSPLAEGYHAQSVGASAGAPVHDRDSSGRLRIEPSVVEQGVAAQAQGDLRKANAHFLRAWILESKAYRETLGLLLDVVATTVLYFVLLIPFSLLIERLVFPQRTVLRTALVAVAVFAVFAGLLYWFHPGFKLAHNIVVTTTAFVIVVMTIPALILLLMRGVAMLRAIGSKRVITQQSEAESAGVVMAALSLAVSNMRRRKLRTVLTLLTITALVMALVLLTTSSAFDFRILEPSDVSGASLQGIQIYNATDRRQPLLTEMVEVLEAAYGDQATLIRRESVNYGQNPSQPENAVAYLEANGRRAPLPYLQLMDPRDGSLEYTLTIGNETRTVRLSDLAREVDPAGRFLAPDDVDVCLLPNNLAESLEISVGDTVTIMGLPLEVIGVFQARSQGMQDGNKVYLPGTLDKLKDLDGLPVTAMRGASFRQGEADNPVHAPSTEVVIVPRAWIRKYGIFPSVVHSLLVIPNGADKDPSKIPALAGKLATEVLNVDVFSNWTEKGENATPIHRSARISMHTATHVKGSNMMLVIGIVAVLMIVAIMTGTVHERMQEIHIFSSVGLSPRHVAGMFLIEALVFAGIAAVLGYFLGIIALKGLLWHLKSTGQAADFYPNYLGVFVLYSIGLAVLATVASAIYPIRLASRIVNPAAEGKGWKVDQAERGDDHWNIRLPFIATTWDEARAMMVYAYDFLIIHQGERSGRFVCQRPPACGRQGQTIHVEMPIWLAPFERNLTQQTRLAAGPADDADWWVLTLTLDRDSGPPYLWQRGAKVFVDALCKHLLRWRAATPDQEADCLGRSDRIFGQAPEAPRIPTPEALEGAPGAD